MKTPKHLTASAQRTIEALATLEEELSFVSLIKDSILTEMRLKMLASEFWRLMCHYLEAGNSQMIQLEKISSDWFVA